MIRFLPLLLALGACKGGDTTDTDTDVVVPNVGPELAYTPPDALIAGTPLTIAITASDPDTVEQVTLFWRTVGESAWSTAYLQRTTGDTFATELPGTEIAAPAIEYYFRAQDAVAVPGVTYLPDNGLHPFVVDVSVVGEPLPLIEDFEGSGNFGVYDLGWSLESDGFPGYGFDITDTVVHGGEASVRHKRGLDGLSSSLTDWLITPPLDFSDQTAVELSWYEYGDVAELSNHSVWVSTTSGVPADGGFVEVTPLAPPPEHAWGRSPIVDLSQFAGDQAVWIAFKYEGDFADAWWIDDVTVQTLGPELDATGFTPPTDIVAPGDTVSLALDVANVTSVASGPLTVTWTVPDGAGVVVGSPFDVASIDGNGTATFTGALQIDPAFPDNTPMPIHVDATNGTETWSWDERFLVGQPTTASVDMTWSNSGLVQMTLGRGDPRAPSLELPLVSEIAAAGAHHYTLDLTDYASIMPPGPGPDRWWVRVTGALSGQITAFDIDWDGQTFVGDDLGLFGAATPKVFYLPKPPQPYILNPQTSPTVPAPGGSVVWTATMVNGGATTVGETTATMTSTDPDVVVTTTDPFVLAADGWDNATPVPVSFGFDIAASHTNSRAVHLDLIVSDALESFDVPVAAPVPWPLLAVTRVVVTDRTHGNNDGILDPGEQANLKLQLANVGGLGTSGSVNCTLSRTGGTADANVLQSVGNFGVLSPGGSRDQTSFEVAVTDGVVGDVLEMQLACADTAHSYVVPFAIEIGRPLWNPLSILPDGTGDNGGYAFDFVRGWWRTDGTTIDFRFDSAVPYDASTLFIEGWFTSIGSDYQYYQFVLQSGVAKLRGSDLFGVFSTIPTTPRVTYVDADTIEISFDVAPLGLFLDQMQIGWGAGFCGGDDHYCDHYADGWGYADAWDYPGTTLIPSAMFNISW